jgi:hypothetical protein
MAWTGSAVDRSIYSMFEGLNLATTGIGINTE